MASSIGSIQDESALSELASRWRAARCAALRSCVADAAEGASERDLLVRALEGDRAAVQKAVFDNSLKLGRGFRRYHRQVITLAELPRMLPALDAPCADGVFRSADEQPGVFLVRPGCAMKDLGAGACDVWHEALHGLVLGLTDGLYHTRHSSLGHGGSVCVDVFHEEGSELAYGAIPEDVQAGLEQIARLMRSFDSSLSLEFLGINDGALHYRITQGHDTKFSARTQVERQLRKRFPHLSAHEVSPRPVMAG